MTYSDCSRHRHFLVPEVFLIFNVVVCGLAIVRRSSPKQTMGFGSAAVAANICCEVFVALLLVVLVVQCWGYGLPFDFHFILRNSSTIGGLMLVILNGITRRTTDMATYRRRLYAMCHIMPAPLTMSLQR